MTRTSGKYQNKEKLLKRKRRFGLAANIRIKRKELKRQRRLGLQIPLLPVSLHKHCVFSENSIRQVLQLFENHKKLSDILKEKVNTAAGKKGKSSAKPPHSLLSLKMITMVLEALIG